MIALLLAAQMAMQTAPADLRLELCKPVLARKAGGEIATIDVSSSSIDHGRQVIEGRLTAYQRMGPAPAGSARTHHLARFEFTYRCEIRAGRVQKVRLNLFQG